MLMSKQQKISLNMNKVNMMNCYPKPLQAPLKYAASIQLERSAVKKEFSIIFVTMERETDVNNVLGEQK